MEKTGLLNDTVVVLVSDHGLHICGYGLALQAEDMKIELNLPALMVRLP
jgi:arylsulfatase A-like enzyme